MKMAVVSDSNTELKEFIELVLMWHCAGDIPMDRASTCAFIEEENFPCFMTSLKEWCSKLGLAMPSRTQVVITLHTLYS